MLDNIEIVPAEPSAIESRDDVDTYSMFAKNRILTPILPSPMLDCVESHNLNKILDCESFGWIHRFQSLESQISEFELTDRLAGISLGVKQINDRFEQFYDMGCRNFLIDCANGASIHVKRAVDHILSKDENVYITTGNVISKQCLQWLADNKVYAARIGIGGGKACSTRWETGIYRNPSDTMMDLAEVKGIVKIWDGGVSLPCHMCKALALGMDFVMAGALFARCVDSPAIYDASGTKKIFRGSASKEIHNGYSGYTEGEEIMLDVSKRTSFLLKRFNKGLKSFLSYLNYKSLDEFFTSESKSHFEIYIN